MNNYITWTAAEFNGTSVVFTWESTGATGLIYKCSLNNGSLFNCEFIFYTTSNCYH